MSVQQVNRRSVLLTLIALCGLGAASRGLAQTPTDRAARDAQAELFVQTEGQKMLTVLGDRGLKKADKEAAFRRMLDQVVDYPRVTGFVLGKYARIITPAQRQQFNGVFRTYLQSLYQSHLADFRGNVLKVTGSMVRAPGDTLVNSVVTGGGAPLPVSWRVMGPAGALKVVDVQARGVWLAITLQQDFVSTLDSTRGDIDILIARLQRDSSGR